MVAGIGIDAGSAVADGLVGTDVVAGIGVDAGSAVADGLIEADVAAGAVEAPCAGAWALDGGDDAASCVDAGSAGPDDADPMAGVVADVGSDEGTVDDVLDDDPADAGESAPPASGGLGLSAMPDPP